MREPPPEPAELIYASGDSGAPILVAGGLAIAVAGAFTVWFWSVIGALILLAGLRSWWKRTDDEVSRMRREQPLATAVIPAEPVRRAARGGS